MIQVEYFPLLGGVDQASAPLAIQPGRLINAINYEISKTGKGYRYPEGYERYDGQVSPSAANYTLIEFEGGREEITAGTTVTTNAGGSGATGVCIVTAVVESGSYAADDAVGYVVILATSGTFLVTDQIKVGVDIYVTDITAVHTEGSGASTYAIGEAWKALGVTEARGNITTVTGSGNILGVHRYNGVTYVVRNNAGGTAAVMYKSSATGWTLVDLKKTVAFTAGTAAFVVAETLTQGGVTAVIRKVIVTSGSWSGSDAAGNLIIDTPSGGNFAAGAATSASGAATLSGAQTANTLTAGGKYEFINYNFGGHSSTLTMYGVNGVNKAFEFDGTAFAFITTGMTTDTPDHIAAHQNHLFLSFSGGSVQHSSLVSAPLTAPHVWSAVTGAAEFGVGDDVTGFANTAGETLTIFSVNSTKILYGESLANWNLQDHSDTAGAVEWTIQKLSEPIYIDAKHVTNLGATNVYGGLSSAALSADIQTFMNTNSGTEVCSTVNLEKSQYRLFFSNKRYLSLSISSKGIAGFMFGELTHTPTCACYDNETGEVFFGASNGYVYQMDKGTSHDGTAFPSHLYIPFNFFKSPRHHKRFFKVIYEINTENSSSISFSFKPEYNYMNSNIPAAVDSSISYSEGNLVWDVGEWDVYAWAGADSDDYEQPEAYIDGLASEMAIIIFGNSATQASYTLNGVFVEYSIHGKER